MTQEYGQAGAPVRTAREMNGLAVASFTVAMTGLCGPLAILGLIMGYVARGQIRTRNNSGAGLAKAAIVLGWISVIVFVVFVLVAILGGLWDNWDEWKQDWQDSY